MVARTVAYDAETLKKKLLSKLDMSGGPDACWPFKSAVKRSAYGQISVGINNGKSIPETSHRLSYKLFNGPIADGLFVCHSCDYRPCGNPKHLWLGTNKDNMVDAVKKGKLTDKCPMELHPRGESHGCAKLTDNLVRQIRRAYNEEAKGFHRVAKQFGVSKRTVIFIIQGKTWKHVL
jgi:hypothetical protein